MSNFCLKPQLSSIKIIQEKCFSWHCRRSYDEHDLFLVFCDSRHKQLFVDQSDLPTAGALAITLVLQPGSVQRIEFGAELHPILHHQDKSG